MENCTSGRRGGVPTTASGNMLVPWVYRRLALWLSIVIDICVQPALRRLNSLAKSKPCAARELIGAYHILTAGNVWVSTTSIALSQNEIYLSKLYHWCWFLPRAGVAMLFVYFHWLFVVGGTFWGMQFSVNVFIKHPLHFCCELTLMPCHSSSPVSASFSLLSVMCLSLKWM